MKKLVRPAAIVSTLLLVGAGIGLVRGRSASVQPVAQSNAESSTSVEAAKSAPVALATVPATAQVKEPTQAPPVAPAPSFAYEKELTSFANLRAKVFLNPEEKSRRSALLANETLLRATGPLLKVPAPVGTEIGQMQNYAIDLLLEAKSHGDQVAGEILRSVIQDSQVEDEKADPQSRRLLAGLKAEVLFQWSAREPSRASEMGTWLPGPVSQKIWANVQAAQRQNLAESAASH